MTQFVSFQGGGQLSLHEAAVAHDDQIGEFCGRQTHQHVLLLIMGDGDTGPFWSHRSCELRRTSNYKGSFQKTVMPVRCSVVDASSRLDLRCDLR